MSIKTAYYSALVTMAAVGTILAEALGGWDTALQTLLILMAIDYLTGLLCALVWRRSPKTDSGAFESKASLKGLIRKGAILLVVYIAAQLDRLMGTSVTRLAVIMFFIANDGFSIIENLGIMGVPMPEGVKNAFALLRQQGEQDNPANSAEQIPDKPPDEEDEDVLQPYTFGPGDLGDPDEIGDTGEPGEPFVPAEDPPET